jgi:glycosyltransferase involved in cell wall biosynthesis
VPGFQLVIVGDGPQRELVQKAVDESGGWIHWLGAQTGRDKARVLSMSQLMLNPGMVGLSILDSLVAGVPMVTTAYPHHSPEIVYLHSGQNGLMTENNVDSFAAGVVHLLNHPEELDKLRAGCRASAEEYTIEKMADHFCNGILACLSVQEKEKNRSRLGRKTVSGEQV